MVAWRARLRTWFQDYTVLANGVQQFLKVELPEMDLTMMLIGTRGRGQDYTVLANGVQQFLKVELPEMDLTILESVPTKRPRQVIPPS